MLWIIESCSAFLGHRNGVHKKGTSPGEGRGKKQKHIELKETYKKNIFARLTSHLSFSKIALRTMVHVFTPHVLPQRARVIIELCYAFVQLRKLRLRLGYLYTVQCCLS